jgi:hypothetical protein
MQRHRRRRRKPWKLLKLPKPNALSSKTKIKIKIVYACHCCRALEQSTAWHPSRCYLPLLQNPRAICSATFVTWPPAITMELTCTLQRCGLWCCVVVRHCCETHMHFTTPWPLTSHRHLPSLWSSQALYNVVTFNVCLFDICPSDICPTIVQHSS